MRWLPFKIADAAESKDFVQSLHTICGAGDPSTQHGIAVHMYLCNASMHDSAFYNSDGDFLIGKLKLDVGRYSTYWNRFAIIYATIKVLKKFILTIAAIQKKLRFVAAIKSYGNSKTIQKLPYFKLF